MAPLLSTAFRLLVLDEGVPVFYSLWKLLVMQAYATDLAETAEAVFDGARVGMAVNVFHKYHVIHGR